MNIKFSLPITPNPLLPNVNIILSPEFNNNNDLCFIEEIDYDENLISNFKKNHQELLNLKLELAEMHTIRELNSIETLIDYSLTPNCTQIMEYSKLWDPDFYNLMHQDMIFMTKDDILDEETDDNYSHSANVEIEKKN